MEKQMVTKTVGGIEITACRELWQLAGWDGSYCANPDGQRLVVEALSEGLRGEDALRRAVAIASERRQARTLASEPRRAIEAEQALERLRLARIEAEMAAARELVED